ALRQRLRGRSPDRGHHLPAAVARGPAFLRTRAVRRLHSGLRLRRPDAGVHVAREREPRRARRARWRRAPLVATPSTEETGNQWLTQEYVFSPPRSRSGSARSDRVSASVSWPPGRWRRSAATRRPSRPSVAT